MLRRSSANHSDSHGPGPDRITEEAALDAVATEKLKSNSRPHICVPLQPPAPGLAQFVTETSRECDFMERLSDDDPGLDTHELFNRYPTVPTCVAAMPIINLVIIWLGVEISGFKKLTFSRLLLLLFILESYLCCSKHKNTGKT